GGTFLCGAHGLRGGPSIPAARRQGGNGDAARYLGHAADSPSSRVASMASELEASAAERFAPAELLAHKPVVAWTGDVQDMVILQSSGGGSKRSDHDFRRAGHAAAGTATRARVFENRRFLPPALPGCPRSSFSDRIDRWQFSRARLRRQPRLAEPVQPRTEANSDVRGHSLEMPRPPPKPGPGAQRSPEWPSSA